MPPVAFLLRVTQKVSRESVINISTFIASLDEKRRREYTDLDLNQWGFSHEWERPFAYTYVYATESSGIDAGTVHGSMLGHVVSEQTDSAFDDEARLSRRGDKNVYGGDAEWTEDDFWSLAEGQDWLVDILMALDPNTPSEKREEYERALALRPGSMDVPLFV